VTTGTLSRQRPDRRMPQAHFTDIVRAEWIKFRSVRGWVIGMIVAAILTIFVGVFAAGAANIGCIINGVQKSGRACLPFIPIGPGGEAVQDSFNFVHQPLTGDGSITARLTSFSGEYVGNGPVQVGGAGPNMKPGLMPWSKAGIMIKASVRRGSAYAAMLATGSHGIRMQWNYTGDTAGLPGAVSTVSPRWLRLTRSGDMITGYDSATGTQWTEVGTVQLTGLPATVQVGMFATSPSYVQTSRSFGGSSNEMGPSQATGVFDHAAVFGAPAGQGWTGTAIGGGSIGAAPGGNGGAGHGVGPAFRQSGGAITLTGSGDIAPVVPGPGGGGYPTTTVEQSLAGVFIGLIAIVVVAVMFFSTEYRRGLIRTTLAATPRRSPVLAAKAVVIGSVAFVAGLAASIIAIVLGVPRQEAQGQFLLPVPAITDVRVVLGTAALVAVAAVFAVAVGAIMRRSAAAISTVVVAIVLPFLLAALNVFPPGISAWLLRLTPAAGLAIEQSIPHYPQVVSTYSPAGGYYPLPPWGGFAVLCAYAAAALGLAFVLLRRRDA
jgi:ABC-type transport system involved in multi-copper enzyme maturation permease subunit